MEDKKEREYQFNEKLPNGVNKPVFVKESELTDEHKDALCSATLSQFYSMPPDVQFGVKQIIDFHMAQEINKAKEIDSKKILTKL